MVRWLMCWAHCLLCYLAVSLDSLVSFYPSVFLHLTLWLGVFGGWSFCPGFLQLLMCNMGHGWSFYTRWVCLYISWWQEVLAPINTSVSHPLTGTLQTQTMGPLLAQPHQLLSDTVDIEGLRAGTEGWAQTCIPPCSSETHLKSQLGKLSSSSSIRLDRSSGTKASTQAHQSWDSVPL